MTQFFKTLSLVSLSLALVLLEGCGMSPGSRSNQSGEYFPQPPAPTTTTSSTQPISTALSCTLKINGTLASTSPVSVAQGQSVAVEVRALGGPLTGANYNFRYVRFNNVQYNTFSISSTNRALASLSITMPSNISGTLPMAASIARQDASGNDLETVECSGQVSIGSLALNLTATDDKWRVDPGQEIAITPQLRGSTTATNISYAVTTSGATDIRTSFSNGVVYVSQEYGQRNRTVLGNGVSVTVDAYNSSGVKLASATRKVFFAPPLQCELERPAGTVRSDADFTSRILAVDRFGTRTGEVLKYARMYVTESDRNATNRLVEKSRTDETVTVGFNIVWGSLPSGSTLSFRYWMRAYRYLDNGNVEEFCETPNDWVIAQKP